MPEGDALTETVLRAAKHAADQAHIGSSGTTLLRLGERAVVALDHGRVIARVERSARNHEGARREVRVARWLDSAGLPVGRPLPGAQPWISGDGAVVTLWEAIYGEWTVPVELATLLARLHRLAPPADLELPALAPFSRIGDRIHRAQIPSEDKQVLQRRLIDLRAAYAGVRTGLARSVIHGDANIGNVQMTKHGAVLYDLDGVCWGPPEWDLVLTALYTGLGWHTETEYREFCTVYGFDVRTWEGYPVYKRVWELIMVSWLAQKAGESVEVDTEIQVRIADLADPARPRAWNPY
ncbi:phosphotransferase family enzyme [Murinocardiopsis flavida]|uniref:Phosphotransferase family enzyme n=1 Tax=Murinocardiopsis flavida TaxID=645275 RepID=A0A2P8DG51_9ACTN|nr:aminoglycoside phosphotransferase family protein [Murinocardiopsis flavida]PSK96197.1 phosphotransferase family enzyme [Murinocardiopsis flavida]